MARVGPEGVMVAPFDSFIFFFVNRFKKIIKKRPSLRIIFFLNGYRFTTARALCLGAPIVTDEFARVVYRFVLYRYLTPPCRARTSEEHVVRKGRIEVKKNCKKKRDPYRVDYRLSISIVKADQLEMCFRRFLSSSLRLHSRSHALDPILLCIDYLYIDI